MGTVFSQRDIISPFDLNSKKVVTSYVMKIVQKWSVLVKLKFLFYFCGSIWKYNYLVKLPE